MLLVRLKPYIQGLEVLFPSEMTLLLGSPNPVTWLMLIEFNVPVGHPLSTWNSVPLLAPGIAA